MRGVLAQLRQRALHRAAVALRAGRVQAVDLLALQRGAASLALDDAVLDYVVRIVRATRTWSGVAAGAGPRGSIALIRSSSVTCALKCARA